MTIHNRDVFLKEISKRLGRSSPLMEKPVISWNHHPQQEVLKDASKETLVEILVEQCQNIHTKIKICSSFSVVETLKSAIDELGRGAVIYPEDKRLNDLKIDALLQSMPGSFKWQPILKEKNKELAQLANIGIVVSDLTLAESATIMLQINKDIGRSISFLPQNSIAIIPKSTIVPRLTQAAQFLRKSEQPLSTCINFITGPSNSADIEMNLVVGVHGPITMTYIVVEDF